MDLSTSKKGVAVGVGNGEGGSPDSSGSSGGAEERTRFEYFGWVYHLGVNSLGHEYCHLRFLFIRGKHVEMYKRDPHKQPGIKPIRRGVVGHTLMVEELGRRKVNDGEFYVLRFYNRLDDSRKGEIACTSAGETRKWMEAFDHAKQMAEYELSRGGSARNKLNMETEINLEGHRPRVRRYAHGLKKLIKIGQGPESLLRQSSNLPANIGADGYCQRDDGDVIEAHEWKCVRTANGIRIFEDVAGSKTAKSVLVKAVGVVDASADTVFEVLMDVNRHKRYEWDTLTGDLELVDRVDGHYDVVYGTYDPRHLTRWHSKRDFVFFRQWFRGQDGTYTILQSSTVHKNCPLKSGYRRSKINPSTWDIRSLNTSPTSNGARCLVTQILEMHAVGWFRWKNNQWSKFERTVPYALMSQVAGLKEYFGANPSLSSESSITFVQTKFSDVSSSNSEYEDVEDVDEFYDATDDEDSDDEVEIDSKEQKVKLKNISWAIASLALKRTSAPDLDEELDPGVPPVVLDPSYHGSLHQGKDETDTNCWTSPSGSGFMIRGKTYLKDSLKVSGGDPLLKLIAVDWLKVENCISQVALHPRSLVQSEAGKKLPFILIVNLEVPARPNYSLVLYYAADRPINNKSLLSKFVDGTDMFRDSRFKLIPRIVEGYWMVKRAVGTKACLLGKAVSCKYLRQDNFLEAKEEAELPEYILGTVRLNRVKLDSAVPLEP
ncbi:protein ENHANCED DISEASE RESISTANCE 2 isoform X2 [Diospyros lotus]|uniref:protein ENHANCED DISEASE RESISTANCE 2 isoform X2 n=1 Tax=Diospyros lotus TaxID=55363 RepID=UPI0022507D9F|nr:protein ENHANCED DISEASE RESISTANCE 2 isoform X2 [Diospyros lotus]